MKLRVIAFPLVYVALFVLFAVADFPPAVIEFVRAVAALGFALFASFVLEAIGIDLQGYATAAIAVLADLGLAFLAGVVGQFPADFQPLIVQALVVVIAFVTGYFTLKLRVQLREYRRLSGKSVKAFWNR